MLQDVNDWALAAAMMNKKSQRSGIWASFYNRLWEPAIEPKVVYFVWAIPLNINVGLKIES